MAENYKLSRRDFIKAAALGLAGLVLGGAAFDGCTDYETAGGKREKSPYRHRRLCFVGGEA